MVNLINKSSSTWTLFALLFDKLRSQIINLAVMSHHFARFQLQSQFSRFIIFKKSKKKKKYKLAFKKMIRLLSSTVLFFGSSWMSIINIATILWAMWHMDEFSNYEFVRFIARHICMKQPKVLKLQGNKNPACSQQNPHCSITLQRTVYNRKGRKKKKSKE